MQILSDSVPMRIFKILHISKQNRICDFCRGLSSYLEVKTALSTMEPEHVALSIGMRELIYLKYGVRELSSCIGFKLKEYTEMKIPFGKTK